MIEHTVVFRLSRPVDDEARQTFIRACEAFADQAPFAVSRPEIRADLVLRNEGRSSSEAEMRAVFADEDAFRAYLAAPAHVAFVENVLIPSCETWLSVQSTSS